MAPRTKHAGRLEKFFLFAFLLHFLLDTVPARQEPIQQFLLLALERKCLRDRLRDAIESLAFPKTSICQRLYHLAATPAAPSFMVLQGKHNFFYNTIDIIHHLMIPKTYDFIALRS